VTVLLIVMHPDPVLRQVCEAAQLDQGMALRELSGDMLETMYAAKGRGLAAPQVGQAVRLFVFDATWKEGVYTPHVCINPVIEPIGDEVKSVEEQCLSIPDQPVFVERPAKIEMTWFDADLRRHQQVFTGSEAVVIQHEADHLEGRLVLDYLEDAQ
jgi:peptide deformylase